MRTLVALALVFLPTLVFGAPTVEVKAAHGVDKREPVEPSDSFAVKDTIWVWTRVIDGDGTKIKHVWRRDGKDVWSIELPVRSKAWHTNSRRTVSKPGSYVVEVLGEDGAKLGEVAFTVK